MTETSTVQNSEAAERDAVWQKMRIGERIRTMRRTITETDVVNFVTSAGFFEVLFMDVPYVENESAYGNRLVPAALTYSFAEGLVIQSSGIQRTGMAFLEMHLRALKPVFVGDTIDVDVEVVDVRPTRKSGRGVVTTKNVVRNQHGETVLEYTPVRLIKGADQAAETAGGVSDGL